MQLVDALADRFSRVDRKELAWRVAHELGGALWILNRKTRAQVDRQLGLLSSNLAVGELMAWLDTVASRAPAADAAVLEELDHLEDTSQSPEPGNWDRTIAHQLLQRRRRVDLNAEYYLTFPSTDGLIALATNPDVVAKRVPPSPEGTKKPRPLSEIIAWLEERVGSTHANACASVTTGELPTHQKELEDRLYETRRQVEELELELALADLAILRQSPYDNIIRAGDVRGGSKQIVSALEAYSPVLVASIGEHIACSVARRVGPLESEPRKVVKTRDVTGGLARLVKAAQDAAPGVPVYLRRGHGNKSSDFSLVAFAPSARDNALARAFHRAISTVWRESNK